MCVREREEERHTEGYALHLELWALMAFILGTLGTRGLVASFLRRCSDLALGWQLETLFFEQRETRT